MTDQPVPLALEAVGIRTGYLRAPILHEVSLAVRPHEVVGLLGANGAGKSTLMRVLSGSLSAWDGTVSLHGNDVTTAAAWSRVRGGMAHVPEGRHVFTAMSVDENLDAAALVAPAGTSQRRQLVRDLFPRLAERAEQRAGSLSGGEQQMLAIGRALMTDPSVLLIDELSAGLAPVIVDQLVQGLRAIRAQGIAVLLVEQSPHFVSELVDRIILLDHGRVVADGSLEDLGGASSIANIYLGVS